MRDRKNDKHRKVGAPVPPGHDRHHKDGNKENNDPMNFEDMPHHMHSKITAREKGTLRKLRHALSMPARKEKLY